MAKALSEAKQMQHKVGKDDIEVVANEFLKMLDGSPTSFYQLRSPCDKVHSSWFNSLQERDEFELSCSMLKNPLDTANFLSEQLSGRR